MPLLLRQPRTSQPQGPATIDWTNPITRGLVFCQAPQGPDAARAKPKTTTGAVGRGVNKFGQFASFGGGVNESYPAFGSELTNTTPATVFWLQEPRAGALYSTVAQFRPSGSSQPFLIYQSTSDASYNFVIGQQNGAVPSFGLTIGAPTNNVPVSHAIVTTTNLDSRTVGDWTAYKNGVGFTTATTTNFGSSAATLTTIGSVGGGSDPFEGLIGNLCIWNRALSATEIKSLSANPWQIFTPQSRQIWLPTSGVSTHTTTGALAAQAATIAGTATHLTLHTTSGAMAAQSATIAGTATHLKLHTTTGALAGQAATISGAALHPHTTSGALVAGSATIAGTAARAATGTHATSGALIAGAAVVAGTAAHLKVHTTTGALAAGSATISGLAAGPIVLSVGGGGFIPQKSYRYRYKVDEKLDAIAPEVAQVIKAEAITHIDDPKAAQVKTALASVGIDYKKSYQQIYKELVQEMRDEEEQIAIAIALMI